MNSCGKSFHIANKAVFSSAMLVGFENDVIFHRILNMQRVSKYVCTTWISALLFLCQNYSFITCSLRANALLSSNSYNFLIKPNIVMKFAGYVAWILLCKRCKFCDKICYNSRDIEFFLGDCFFIGKPCILYLTTEAIVFIHSATTAPYESLKSI